MPHGELFRAPQKMKYVNIPPCLFLPIDEGLSTNYTNNVNTGKVFLQKLPSVARQDKRTTNYIFTDVLYALFSHFLFLQQLD